MFRQLLVCLNANIKLSWRNRLPVAITGFAVVMTLLTWIPMMLLTTSAKQFELLKQIVRGVDGLAYWFTATVAVITLSQPLRSRCAKMVLTKPCPVEVWMGSHFLTGLLIAAALYGISLVVGLGLSAFWGLSVRQGLLFIILDGFCRTVILCSYMILLTALFHPVVAVMIVLFFQENVFYYLLLWMDAWMRVADTAARPAMQALRAAFEAAYTILPSYQPYAHATYAVYSAFRVSQADLKHLAVTFCYTAVFAAFCFLSATLVVKHKRLN